MAAQSVCGFCSRPVEHVVEGPNGAHACWDCLVASRDIIAQMNKPLTCSFCMESVTANLAVEGPNGLHMCNACVESGIKLLGRR